MYQKSTCCFNNCAGYGATGVGTLLDINAYNNGQLSGARFGYNTFGSATGVVVGMVAGPVAGAVTGEMQRATVLFGITTKAYITKILVEKIVESIYGK